MPRGLGRQEAASPVSELGALEAGPPRSKAAFVTGDDERNFKGWPWEREVEMRLSRSSLSQLIYP